MLLTNNLEETEYKPPLTFSESVVMLMEGFLAVTAVLEPHLLFLPAKAPESASVGEPRGAAGGVAAGVAPGDSFPPAGRWGQRLSIQRLLGRQSDSTKNDRDTHRSVRSCGLGMFSLWCSRGVGKAV